MQNILIAKDDLWITAFNKPQISGKIFKAFIKNPKKQSIENKLRSYVKDLETQYKVLSIKKAELEKQDSTDETLQQISAYNSEMENISLKMQTIVGPPIQKGDVKKLRFRIMKQVIDPIILLNYPTTKIIYEVTLVDKLPKNFKTSEPKD